MSARSFVVWFAVSAVAGIGPVSAQTTEGSYPEPAYAAVLTDANYGAWSDHIRAFDSERAWAQLPWLMSLKDGLEAAGAAGKPLLLWTMNGHPFGCT